MITCPYCKKEIDQLEILREYHVSNLYIASDGLAQEDYAYYDKYGAQLTVSPNNYIDEYFCCPECGERLCCQDYLAREFLEGKADIKVD